MADTDIICEPEVQKSALNVIINLVCAPSDMVSSFDYAVGIVFSESVFPSSKCSDSRWSVWCPLSKLEERRTLIEGTTNFNLVAERLEYFSYEYPSHSLLDMSGGFHCVNLSLSALTSKP